MDGGTWKAAVHGVAEGRTWLSDFAFTFHFDALEKEMATHSSVLAWRIPAMGEPGGLPSMGSHRVGQDWSDSPAAAWKYVGKSGLYTWHIFNLKADLNSAIVFKLSFSSSLHFHYLFQLYTFPFYSAFKFPYDLLSFCISNINLLFPNIYFHCYSLWF